jgi:chemotaxis protein CheD
MSMHEAIGVVRAQPGADVNLLAGQLCFGPGPRRIHTLLGSCVALALWNPRHRIGGMCHFMLPSRIHQPGQPLDARFGEEAVHLLVEAIRATGTKPADYETHLYGGADTLPGTHGVKFNIGERNIEMGWTLIEHHGFPLVNVDVGDHMPRKVALDLHTGDVAAHRGQPIREMAA